VAPKAERCHDDMVLEAAVNGRAEAIVTFNARDFADVADEFGLALLTPNAILSRMSNANK
jgi:predicted nucleic acid-binding protein